MARISWGTGMAITMSLFALMMAFFVVRAFRSPTALTTTNPYADELRYSDDIIAGRQNLAALGHQPTLDIDPDAQKLLLRLPLDAKGTQATGTVLLRHAANPNRDLSFALQTDAQGLQALPLDGILGNRWSIIIRWTAAGKPYYYETAQVF